MPSNERAGAPSLKALFTVDQRFTGVDHGSLVSSLVATQRSSRPCPMARLDVMNISSPSRRMAVRVSRKWLLSSGTRQTEPNVSSS